MKQDRAAQIAPSCLVLGKQDKQLRGDAQVFFLNELDRRVAGRRPAPWLHVRLEADPTLLEAAKVLQQLQANRLTFFGMKLRRH